MDNLKLPPLFQNGLRVRSRDKKTNPKDYWLEHAEAKHGKKLVLETKILLNILTLYVVLPVFWALFDQQGSRWTFQATRMNGDIGFMEIKPDQIQVINPALILIFIPLYEIIFYPLLAKVGVSRPLQKLTLGGILAGVAFVISAVVELSLEQTYAVLPRSGEAQLRIYNGMNCAYIFQGQNTGFKIEALERFEDKHVWLKDNKFAGPFSVRSEDDPSCPDFPESFQFNLSSQETVGYIMRLNEDKLELAKFLDDPNKSRSGFPAIRVLANVISNGNITIEGEGTVRYNNKKFHTERIEVPSGAFDFKVDGVKAFEGHFKLGGVYTLILRETIRGAFHGKVQVITDPNSLNILWQIPQYVVLTLGEVMFSVTGLQFSFTQAPESMKSVLMGCWNLTVAFGNLIVILITSVKIFDSQASEFFLFAGLMFVDMAAFSWLAYRYKPIPLEMLSEVDEEESKETDTLKKSALDFNGTDNLSFDKKE
jgi:solute carrier family 15 oligopeptide transporter 1